MILEAADIIWRNCIITHCNNRAGLDLSFREGWNSFNRFESEIMSSRFFQAKQESLTTIWWWILHEIIASEDEGNRTEQPYKKANLSISTKKLDYWLFDDQRSLKLRYVYYVPSGGRTSPAGRGTPVPSEFWGGPIFFGTFPEFKILWGSPTLSSLPLRPPGTCDAQRY